MRDIICTSEGFPILDGISNKENEVCQVIQNGQPLNVKKVLQTPSVVQVFTRLTREIVMAARDGGSDVEFEFSPEVGYR